MIFTVIGARPQFVKAAVLSRQLELAGIPEYIVHTGQHYDYKMSEVFFTELGLSGAQVNLNVGSGSHGAQTAEILVGIERLLLARSNDISHVLLYGDTNSTLAGALAASKLNIPIIHVEAGLRSYNMTMPEEVNRIMTDHVSSLLFCSSEVGVENLRKEGITKGVHISGDIMLDAFITYSAIAHQKTNIRDVLRGINTDYFLLTIHRPANTDNPANISQMLSAFATTSKEIVWPVHPRTRKIAESLTLPKNVHLYEPFSYFEMMTALNNCVKVITDSGGLQKEAYWAKKPCITIRSETEWIETLHDNWNILCDAKLDSIANAINTEVDVNTWKPLYGSGNAGKYIVEMINR